MICAILLILIRSDVYKQQQISMDTSHLRYSQQKIHQINERKQKYKRSTNNSHKKFICVARKLLYKYCTYRERELFQKHYEPYQNSRVFYFIILSHPKIRMGHNQKQNFRTNLIALLQAKIQTYNQQIRNTNNKNFINFRFEEIADIQFAINALNLYFENKVEQAIEAIYKKEKGFILKKQQYQMAIQTVNQLQSKLISYPQGQMFPYLTQKLIGEQQMEKTSNKYKSKQQQDEEWVLEKRHRQATKKSIRRERGDKQTQNKTYTMLETNSPLLFLEKSYQYNPNFYNILFNHSADWLAEPSYFHGVHPMNMVRENETICPYVPLSPQRQSFRNQQQLHQQHVDDNYLPIEQTVKRQQIAEIDYFGIVKSEIKDKDMLIPPPTTKEYDPCLN